MIRRHYPPHATRHQTGRGAESTPMRRALLPLTAIALGLLASGCVYRVNIAQGNYLEAKMLDQVQLGMTRSQVRYVLGTPMISDPFHPDRWDYLYYFKDGKTRSLDTRLVVVYFADEKVAKIDKPAGEFKNPTLSLRPII